MPHAGWVWEVIQSCMHVESLCKPCAPRLCNMYVQSLATYMCIGRELLIIPCMEGLRVLVLALTSVHGVTRHLQWVHNLLLR